ncbi:hypothetical protein CLOM_g24518 [Closterium sp. NIES-68]|nr:hypothetical protein CLOM_g24518 [Closterium sp. NIES-68]GJP64192.1 hypothetical protein CLOP_g21207 [Closterium sp. NIES-67]GJP75519.1 hypothetical protein CLOP_g5956 [Closterium sp. NIES-67]GJP84956.1 hypothetical protein CLOP_g15001 [Closterium sp. NIES-67]
MATARDFSQEFRRRSLDLTAAPSKLAAIDHCAAQRLRGDSTCATSSSTPTSPASHPIPAVQTASSHIPRCASADTVSGRHGSSSSASYGAAGTIAAADLSWLARSDRRLAMWNRATGSTAGSNTGRSSTTTTGSATGSTHCPASSRHRAAASTSSSAFGPSVFEWAVQERIAARAARGAALPRVKAAA